MKKKNSICEFSSQRSEALLENFRKSIAAQSVISAEKAFREAVDSPAPRFWVSEARAVRIISMLLAGKTEVLNSMHLKKQLMYREIFSRVKELLSLYPQKHLGDLVFEVINSPAPSSFITWQWGAKIIAAYKKQKRTNP